MHEEILNWRGKDISGFRNGTLTVVKPTNERSQNGSIIWECICDCGNKIYLPKERIEKNPYCEKCNRKYNFIDFTGKQVGVLSVIEYVGDSNWLCKCECGNEKIVHRKILINGATYACSCKHKLHKADCNTTHGKSNTRLYYVWSGMKRRCFNKNVPEYSRYGGRGITICDEWMGKDGFENFYKWAYKNGYDENADRGNCTIDRIDVNGNYEPDNCRFIDMKAQQNNRRDNHMIEINGVTRGIEEWCKEYNIKVCTYKSRVRRGMDDVTAITKPTRKFNKDLTDDELVERKRHRLEKIAEWQRNNKEREQENRRKREKMKKIKNYK